MRRTLMLLTIAAVCALPTAWTPVQAQNVEIRNFHANVHPLRKIVQVYWWASEDSTVTAFALEHSTDGVTYSLLENIQPLLTGEDGHIYQYWHVDAVQGLNYYQLSIVVADTITKTIGPVVVDVGRPPIYSYPTLPTVDRPGVRPLTSDPGDPWIEARITDMYGRPVAAIRGDQDMDVPDDLPAGLYILHARYASGWYAQQFVVTQTD